MSSLQPEILRHCLQYCEAMASEESIQPVVLKFLTELCLKEEPVSITDSSTAVPLPPARTFTLDFSGLIKEETARSARRKTLRRSCRLKREEEISGNVCQVLRKCLGKGLALLQGWKHSGEGAEESEDDREAVLELLWCALVCATHVR